MGSSQYSDPRAFRLAITDRLRPLVRDRGIELTDLLRQFAYDRLLCRVFISDPERWVLKGATAMLARLEGVALDSAIVTASPIWNEGVMSRRAASRNMSRTPQI